MDALTWDDDINALTSDETFDVVADERVARKQCRACKHGAHMECWGCGCPCNADKEDDG